MGQKLIFRKLRADEIDVRIGTINKGGVSLLLYKDARCDQNILDEIVGQMNWQRKHSRDNANCIVSIWDDDKRMWVEKEDTGTESFTEKEKGLASDSFKRACFNWGIGRELYTAPDMFVKAEYLQAFKNESENGQQKCRCYDTFRVKEINYAEDKIDSVVIGVYNYGKEHHTLTFSNTVAPSMGDPSKSDALATPPVKNPQTASVKPANSKPNTKPVVQTDEFGFTDDEVVLLGNCRGMTYKEAKTSAQFANFLKWTLTSSAKYPDAAVNEQFTRFKRMAQKMVA